MLRGAISVCLLGTGFIAGSVSQANEAENEAESLQGVWRVVSIIESGKPVSAERVKDSKFEFISDKLVMSGFSEGEEGSEEFDYTLDPTKEPRCIDLIRGDTTIPGIYRIVGGALTLCLPGRDIMTRPTEFNSEEGSDISFVTLERVEEEGARPYGTVPDVRRPIPGPTTASLATDYKDVARESATFRAEFAAFREENAGFRGRVETQLGFLRWLGAFLAAILVTLVSIALWLFWHASALRWHVDALEKSSALVVERLGKLESTAGPSAKTQDISP